MKIYFDFSYLPFNEKRAMYLNFIKSDYGTFNELKILVNCFFKNVKAKNRQIEWDGGSNC